MGNPSVTVRLPPEAITRILKLTGGPANNSGVQAGASLWARELILRVLGMEQYLQVPGTIHEKAWKTESRLSEEQEARAISRVRKEARLRVRAVYGGLYEKGMPIPKDLPSPEANIGTPEDPNIKEIRELMFRSAKIHRNTKSRSKRVKEIVAAIEAEEEKIRHESETFDD